MIPPDHEIYEVEQRIATRRHQAEYLAKESARRAFVALTSPGALAVAAVLGFLAGGGIGRKKPERFVERRKTDDTTTKKAAKATGLAGVLMSGAMFFVRQQFGGPVGLAQFILQKVQGHRTAHKRVERPFAH